MKNFASKLTVASLFSSLLVGCVAGDNEIPEEEARLAATCAEVAAANPYAADGEYTLYVEGDRAKPWRAYCDGMPAAPLEYLTIDGGGFNMSRFVDATGNDVSTYFDKLRIDPAKLTIDIGDRTFAFSYGTAFDANGDVIDALPLGLAMGCGGSRGFAQVGVTGTPFVLASKFVAAGNQTAPASFTTWESNQVIEMGAEGDCAWTAIENGPATREQMVEGTFALQLAYQPQPK